MAQARWELDNRLVWMDNPNNTVTAGLWKDKKLDAQRQYMVIGTLALLLIFCVWFFMWAGQQSQRELGKTLVLCNNQFCTSVHPSVCSSVRPSVHPPLAEPLSPGVKSLDSLLHRTSVPSGPLRGRCPKRDIIYSGNRFSTTSELLSETFHHENGGKNVLNWGGFIWPFEVTVGWR